MVVAAKWTGTNADRHDMEKLELDQVLRVRTNPLPPMKTLRSHAALDLTLLL